MFDNKGNVVALAGRSKPPRPVQSAEQAQPNGAAVRDLGVVLAQAE